MKVVISFLLLRLYIFQKQFSASLLINILALGTGATYGIANVLLAALDEGKSSTSNANNLTQSNVTREHGPWHFTVNSGEASWIGMLLNYFCLCAISSKSYKQIHFN